MMSEIFNIQFLHPSAIYLLGGLFIPLFKGRIKQGYMLFVVLMAFLAVVNMPHGTYGVYEFLSWKLTFGDVDKLSKVFAYIFTIMGVIGVIYSIHVKNDGEHFAAFYYVGGSLGVIFAGDFLTLFLFWEVMAFSSVFLVWFRKSPASVNSGFRYLLWHVAGGLILLAGIILQYSISGDLSIKYLPFHGWWPTDLQSLASFLIVIGFIVNAAVPPFGAWLPDAYPAATVTGAVFMSAFTTKTAVYALIRVCAGSEMLIILGVIMAIYGVVYAVLENDARRLLAYHIISQVGYMVAGVGGCFSLRNELQEFYKLKIFTVVPRDMALIRAVDRDGEEERYWYENYWRREENLYIRTHDPMQRAELVIDGCREIANDEVHLKLTTAFSRQLTTAADA